MFSTMGPLFALWILFHSVTSGGLDFVPVHNFQIVDCVTVHGLRRMAAHRYCSLVMLPKVVGRLPVMLLLVRVLQ